MKYTKLIGLLSLIVSLAYGQDSLDVYNKTPRVALKFAPLSLFDIDPTYQFATEWFFRGGKNSFQLEGGYGKWGYIPKIWSSTATNPSETWRVRPEYRWYRWYRKGTSFYHAVEGLYKQVNERREDEFGRNCATGLGGCSYVEKISYLRVKQVYGLSFKVGWQSVEADHFVFDVYMGFGLRAIAIKGVEKTEESGFSQPRTFIFERNPGLYAAPQLSLGFKVGYMINQSRTSE